MARRVGDMAVAATPVPLGSRRRADAAAGRRRGRRGGRARARPGRPGQLGPRSPDRRRRVALGVSALLAELLPVGSVARSKPSRRPPGRSATATSRPGSSCPAVPTASSPMCAETVDAMATALEDARRDRQRFLVDVSHELRTPLTSISGYAELLADGQITGSGEVRETGQVMGREAARTAAADRRPPDAGPAGRRRDEHPDGAGRCRGDRRRRRRGPPTRRRAQRRRARDRRAAGDRGG